MPNRNNDPIPEHGYALPKGPGHPKLPTNKINLSRVASKELGLGNFCRDAYHRNKEITIIDRPALEAAWVSLCKVKTDEKRLWDGNLPITEKKALEKLLLSTIQQIHGVEGFDLEKQKDKANRLFKFYLDIEIRYVVFRVFEHRNKT